MLPAQYRLRRSLDFGATVKRGKRAVQPDMVIHTRWVDASADGDEGPRVGLIVAKSVGNAVQRHRVSRRLRHVARTVLDELGPGDQVVIRARPGSSHVDSASLERQLRAGLARLRRSAGSDR